MPYAEQLHFRLEQIVYSRISQVFFGIGYGLTLWYVFDIFYLKKKKLKKSSLNLSKEHHYWLAGSLITFLLFGIAAPQIIERIGSIKDINSKAIQVSFSNTESHAIFSDNITDNRSAVITNSFSVLSNLPHRIQQDIIYIEEVEIYLKNQELSKFDQRGAVPNQGGTFQKELEKELDSLRALVKKKKQAVKFMEYAMLPVTLCAEEARTQLVDIALIRQKIRPFFFELWKVIKHPKIITESNGSEKQNIYNNLLDEQKKAMDDIAELITILKNCPPYPDNPYPDNPYPYNLLVNILDEPNFVAGIAKVLAFNNNFNAAIDLLSDPDLDDDFSPNYNYILSNMLFSRQREADEFAKPAFGLLKFFMNQKNKIDEVKAELNEQKKSLNQDEEAEETELSKRSDYLEDIGERADNALLIVHNMFAYGTAQAVAANDRSAEKWWIKAQNSAQHLNELLEKDSLKSNLMPLVRRANILDTISYVSIVREIKKPLSNINYLRIQEARDTLHQAEEILISEIEKNEEIKKPQSDESNLLRSNIATIRRHQEITRTLLSGRE